MQLHKNKGNWNNSHVLKDCKSIFLKKDWFDIINMNYFSFMLTYCIQFFLKICKNTFPVYGTSSLPAILIKEYY